MARHFFSCLVSSLIVSSCPRLCYVGSSIGTRPFPNKSEVMNSLTPSLVLSDVYPHSFINLNPFAGFTLLLSGTDQHGLIMVPGIF